MQRFEDDRGVVYQVGGRATFTAIRMEPEMEYRRETKDEPFSEHISGRYELSIYYFTGVTHFVRHYATDYISLTYDTRERAEAAFNEYIKLVEAE